MPGAQALESFAKTKMENPQRTVAWETARYQPQLAMLMQEGSSHPPGVAVLGNFGGEKDCLQDLGDLGRSRPIMGF
ncbi:79e4b89d-efc0-4f70-98fb-8f0f08fb02bb [Thermothielavioides terrestris]|uniref:79e4b89d-efc0-4f70-98fb-8f0f08fb02bb n=1 Tax=Thermothielavioides terrestris TaxID=2587410 RepID=A0A3S4AWH9_9PEZI|nr:79e4b89d-efc0-4f70-98fb-8f0f08fb02bb [Thermothielavioides terrestris]